jgi:glucose/mannose-6-phosphate isomerase
MLSPSNAAFVTHVQSMAKQIVEAEALVTKIDLQIDKDKIRNIYFCGMGGSAFAGDLLETLCDKLIDIPYMVHRGYHIPKWIHQDSLIIISSYSGNTEEALSNYAEARKHDAQIIAITSGGQLAEKMSGKNTILIPAGLPPRQALGYSFFVLAYSMEKLGFIPLNREAIAETIHVVEGIARHNDPQNHDHKRFAQTFAQALLHRIPVIYADDYSCGSIARRFRNQLNENAKVLAFSNTFPELNHNEIVGYQMDTERLQQFIFVFLRDIDAEEARIKERIDHTRKLLRDAGAETMEIHAEGKSRLARLFSLIHRVDWVSFYLAVLSGHDASDIRNIDTLKQALAEKPLTF